MAALFGTSVNQYTGTLSAATPGPFASYSGTGTATIGAGTGIAGNNTLAFASANTLCTATVPAAIASPNVGITGFGFQYAAAPSTTTRIMQWQGTSQSIYLEVNTSGQLAILDAGGTTFTGTGIVSTGVRHFIEFQVAAFTGGSVLATVKLDNSVYMTATINAAALYPVTPIIGILTSVTWNWTLDSLYLVDNTTSFNNTFLGPGVCTIKMPNGAGQFSAYTANGAATDWQCISEIPPDGDTTYASDITPGDQMATTLGATSGLGAVYFVSVNTVARQEVSSGGRSFAAGVGNGSTTQYGPTIVPTTTYADYCTVFNNNPITGVAWALGDLSSLQAACKTVT